MSYTVPILLLCFNRPEETRQVISAIRIRAPKRLFVAIDGPRAGNQNDTSNVAEVNRIVREVDWDCELLVRARTENLGCKNAVADAIGWFFEHVESGIILEDDTVPRSSFFDFMEFGLSKFAADERVFMVSGHNPFEALTASGPDIFFSKLGTIWGWATWKRAWAAYDINMNGFDQDSDKVLRALFGKTNGDKRKKTLSQAAAGALDTWDYQWSYARHKNWALSCMPRVSLVSNIGFGPSATHTKYGVADLATHELLPPYSALSGMSPNTEFDEAWFRGPSISDRIKLKLSRTFNP